MKSLYNLTAAYVFVCTFFILSQYSWAQIEIKNKCPHLKSSDVKPEMFGVLADKFISKAQTRTDKLSKLTDSVSSMISRLQRLSDLDIVTKSFYEKAIGKLEDLNLRVAKNLSQIRAGPNEGYPKRLYSLTDNLREYASRIISAPDSFTLSALCDARDLWVDNHRIDLFPGDNYEPVNKIESKYIDTDILYVIELPCGHYDAFCRNQSYEDKVSALLQSAVGEISIGKVLSPNPNWPSYGDEFDISLNGHPSYTFDDNDTKLSLLNDQAVIKYILAGKPGVVPPLNFKVEKVIFSSKVKYNSKHNLITYQYQSECMADYGLNCWKDNWAYNKGLINEIRNAVNQ